LPIVRGRRVIAPAASTASSTSPPPSPRDIATGRPPTAPPRREKGRIYHPTHCSHDAKPKESTGPVHISSVEISPEIATAAIFFFALVGQEKAIFNPATPLEDVRIFAGFIAFADDVGRAELELRGKRSGASPLDALRDG
jgi:hypothetical protein